MQCEASESVDLRQEPVNHIWHLKYGHLAQHNFEKNRTMGLAGLQVWIQRKRRINRKTCWLLSCNINIEALINADNQQSCLWNRFGCPFSDKFVSNFVSPNWSPATTVMQQERSHKLIFLDLQYYIYIYIHIYRYIYIYIHIENTQGKTTIPLDVLFFPTRAVKLTFKFGDVLQEISRHSSVKCKWQHWMFAIKHTVSQCDSTHIETAPRFQLQNVLMALGPFCWSNSTYSFPSSWCRPNWIHCQLFCVLLWRLPLVEAVLIFFGYFSNSSPRLSQRGSNCGWKILSCNLLLWFSVPIPYLLQSMLISSIWATGACQLQRTTMSGILQHPTRR